MANPDLLKIGARITMLQLMSDVAQGLVAPTVTNGQLDLSVDFAPDVVPDTQDGYYLYSEALVDQGVLAFFGLKADQPSYVIVKIYATEAPDGTPDPQLSDMWPLPDIARVEPYVSGPRMEAYLLGSENAPWDHFMATGTDSFILDTDGNQIPAPLLTTFPKAMCVGTGWVGKPSKEWSGISSIPPQLQSQE